MFLNKGPDHWSIKFPLASGSHQSPIDIKQSNAQFDSRLVCKPLEYTYAPSCFTKVVNTGHSFKVSGGDDSSIVFLLFFRVLYSVRNWLLFFYIKRSHRWSSQRRRLQVRSVSHALGLRRHNWFWASSRRKFLFGWSSRTFKI